MEALLATELRDDPDALVSHAVRANVRVSANHLRDGSEVLEHLMITGLGMRGLVVELANGRTSDYEVKIENFKPKGKYQGGDAREDFKKFLEETVALLEPLPIEDRGLTHKHPWLGRFNALQWTWLLAGHGGLHLAQLQAIKKGL